MRWAVEAVRHVYYALQPGLVAPDLSPPTLVIPVIALSFAAFIGDQRTGCSTHAFFPYVLIAFDSSSAPSVLVTAASLDPVWGPRTFEGNRD